MPVTTPCPGGGSVTFPGSGVPNQTQVRLACQEQAGMATNGVSKATVRERAKNVKNASGTFGFTLPGTPTFGPSPTTSGLSAGEIGSAIGQAGGCKLLPTQFLRDQCEKLTGAGGNGGSSQPPSTGGSGGSGGLFSGLLGSQQCPTGTIRIGNRCVAPGDAFPGGDPFITQAGGVATQGAFGLPALTPVQEQRVRRQCPTGFVLGKDNLCYPKAVLPRRSKFRKWRPSPRPKVSAAEWKAIRRAERIGDKLKDLTKRHPGLKTAKNK